ncbi:hypothetical protein ACG9YX_00455 [Acinetobacter nematophilus]|uniref:hypothetical protein n=1 Tax=Acinetobacter nematophilus TaxID=2994642 RepID=UPI003AF50C30
MARIFEPFNIWIQKERELKEEFIYNNIQEWCKDAPRECAIYTTQPIDLGPRSQKAVLTSKETVNVTNEFYEVIRKKFRAFKYQKNHQSQGRVQTRVKKSTVSKLEQIKKKLKHSNISATLELIIDNFDEDKIKDLQRIENLENKIKYQRDYEAFLINKHEKADKENQELNSKVQDYLFSQWIETQLKLKTLEEHISNQESLENLYSSQNEKVKNKLLKNIKSELNSDLMDKIINIKATNQSNSDTHRFPLATTVNQEKNNPPLSIKQSAYSNAKQISHSTSLSEEVSNNSSNDIEQKEKKSTYQYKILPE